MARSDARLPSAPLTVLVAVKGAEVKTRGIKAVTAAETSIGSNCS